MPPPGVSGMEPARGLLWLRAVISVALFLICLHNPAAEQATGRVAAVFLFQLLSVAAAAWWSQDSAKAPAFHAAQFLIDVLCVSLALYLTENLSSDLYIVYFLVILGTALTRNLTHSILVGLLAAVLYGALGYHARKEFDIEPAFFYLRIPFLLLTSLVTGFTVHWFLESEHELESRYKERMMQMDKLAGVGQLMSSILHEIKSPLASIELSSEILLDRKTLTAEDRKNVDIIHRQSTRAIGIAKDYLAFVRSEGGQWIAVDIREPIRKALESIEPQLKKGRRDMSVDFKEKAVPEVRGDPDRLHQVFSNLFLNASQAMPDGGVLKIALACSKRKPWWEPGAAAREIVEVRVSDTGMGIPKERLNKIFEPFNSTKGAEGTGLGLTVVQLILQRHKGAITAHSDGPGKGVLFTLELPAADGAPKA